MGLILKPFTVFLVFKHSRRSELANWTPIKLGLQLAWILNIQLKLQNGLDTELLLQ